MADSTPSRPAADRNLLFGILALQMDFISRDALIQAMHSWLLNKNKSLGQLLVEQGALRPDAHALLEPLVQKHLELHGNDPQQSLASVRPSSSVQSDLQQIIRDPELRQIFQDPDLQASLALLGSARTTDPTGTSDGSPTSADPSAAGSRYRILRPHAKGGLGQVHVALDEELHREVAFKEIQPCHAHDPVSRGRFLLEAEVTGRLEHPGIVPVYGLGTYADGRPFYAMRFVRGDNLKEAIRRFHEAEGPAREPSERSLAFRQLLGRFVDVCHAVAYAHSRGVLHRDLKPGNIMLGKYGETLVVDWGLAKPIDRPESAKTTDEMTFRPSSGSGLAATQAGTVIGTPAYMSPEQAAGRLDQVGRASDIYSLGATLYAVLTGRAPFEEGDVWDVVQKVQRGEVIWPRQAKPGTPAALDAICRKAMALKPEERYATAQALAAEIEHWLADEPVSAWREPLTARLRRWGRRHRSLVTGAAVLLLTAVPVLGLSTYLISRQQEATEAARREAEDARGEATARAEAEREARQDRERTLTDTYTSFGLVAGARDDPRQAVLWFANAAWLAGDDRARADANRARAAAWGRQAIQPVRAFVHPAEWIEDMAYHPGSRHLLTHGFDPATKETDCRLWDVEREAAFTFPGNPGVVSTAAWDASGERLAVGTPQGEVMIVRFPSGEPLQRVPYAGRIARVLFSPDGRYCALAAANRARVWDCRQAAFATPELEHPAPVTTLAFHPQGELLATACQDHSCRVFAVPSEKGTSLFAPVGHFQIPFRVVGQKPVPPLFLDEGRGLLTMSRDEVSWRDPRTGRVLRVLPFGQLGTGKNVEAITLSADGKYVVLAGGYSPGGRAQIYDVASAQPVGPPLEHQKLQYVLSAAFSPDGQMLLTGNSDRTARLWSVPEGKPLGGPLTHPTSVSCVACSPDGRHLATAQSGGLIRLWTLPAGNPRDYHVAVGASALVRLSRDGRFLLPTGRSQYGNALRSTQVFDLSSQRVGPPLTAGGLIMDAAFSPDGLQVAAAVSRAASPQERSAKPGQQPGQLLLWAWRAGQLQQEPLPLPSEPRMVDYSSDGRQLAVVCAKGELVLIDPATGKTLRQWQAHPPHLTHNFYTNDGAVRFAPDNHSLLTWGTPTNSVRVWDALTGQLRHELQHQGRCQDVQFSPDGRLAATAAFDNLVCVWELATGEQLASLRHPFWAFTALFSPDGAHLLTEAHKLSKDDLKTFKQLLAMQQFTDLSQDPE
ncbi:MAG: serine/threonine-protein kinase, partial [Gemmataceae bacterium]|nr:serine/threonine-protein kinase [Gemmataceae bacterium]